MKDVIIKEKSEQVVSVEKVSPKKFYAFKGKTESGVITAREYEGPYILLSSDSFTDGNYFGSNDHESIQDVIKANPHYQFKEFDTFKEMAAYLGS